MQLGVLFPAARPEAKEVTCCLCGRDLEPGDYFIKLHLFRLMYEDETGPPSIAREKMEDGSLEKVACYMCPAQYGAPMELIGTSPYTRNDV